MKLKQISLQQENSQGNIEMMDVQNNSNPYTKGAKDR